MADDVEPAENGAPPVSRFSHSALKVTDEKQSAENGLPPALLDYFAKRREHEAALTDQAWAALTPREQALVREASVMGFVRGQFYGPGRQTPNDSAIVHDVLTEVRGFADLYPTLNDLTRPLPSADTVVD